MQSSFKRRSRGDSASFCSECVQVSLLSTCVTRVSTGPLRLRGLPTQPWGFYELQPFQIALYVLPLGQFREGCPHPALGQMQAGMGLCVSKKMKYTEKAERKDDAFLRQSKRSLSETPGFSVSVCHTACVSHTVCVCHCLCVTLSLSAGEPRPCFQNRSRGSSQHLWSQRDPHKGHAAQEEQEAVHQPGCSPGAVCTHR